MCTKTKKAVKIILWSVATPVVILLLAVATSPLWLGSAAKSIANSIVPKKTGVGFEIKNMDLNIFSGKFSVEGTCLKNPEGYKPDEAVKVGKIFVHVNMGSLGSDVIHIKEIAVNDVFASYVSNNGTNNFEWISNHVAAGKDESEEVEDESKASTNETKVVIDSLSVSNSKVQLEFIPLPLPDIKLTDIGKKSNGATLSDVGKQIWEYSQKSVSAVGNLATGLFDSVGGKISDISGKAAESISSTTNALNNVSKSVGDAAEKTTKAISDTATGAVEAAGKGLNKATEAVSEGASKLFEKAGGLFGK